jgi:hypothetical protein
MMKMTSEVEQTIADLAQGESLTPNEALALLVKAGQKHLKERVSGTPSGVGLSLDSRRMITEIAKMRGITASTALERLVKMGYSRTQALRRYAQGQKEQESVAKKKSRVKRAKKAPVERAKKRVVSRTKPRKAARTATRPKQRARTQRKPARSKAA